MGNVLAGLIYNRFWMERISAVLEYFMLDLFFSGGTIFAWLEKSYINNFDKQQRMKPIANDSPTTFDICDWENSEVVGRKRRPAHTMLKSFKSKSDALKFWKERKDEERAVSANIFYLSGERFAWDFVLVGSPQQAPKDWFKDDFSSNLKWSSMVLPCHWQLKGFDTPIYTNTGYPFEFDPPRARRTGHWKVTDCDTGLGGTAETSGPLNPKELGENTTGLYKRKFALPSDWASDLAQSKSRVFLVFEGVDSCLTCWINGTYIGYSQDSCLPAEFDVTDHLVPVGKNGGENVLSVQVSRWCDGSYLEDQDKWWLSGIYRDVFIIKVPTTFISDYEYTCDVTHKTAEGQDEPRQPGGAVPVASTVASLHVNVLVESRRSIVQALKASGGGGGGEGSKAVGGVRVEIWAPADVGAGGSGVPLEVVCDALRPVPDDKLTMRALADGVSSDSDAAEVRARAPELVSVSHALPLHQLDRPPHMHMNQKIEIFFL